MKASGTTKNTEATKLGGTESRWFAGRAATRSNSLPHSSQNKKAHFEMVDLFDVAKFLHKFLSSFFTYPAQFITYSEQDEHKLTQKKKPA